MGDDGEQVEFRMKRTLALFKIGVLFAKKGKCHRRMENFVHSHPGEDIVALS